MKLQDSSYRKKDSGITLYRTAVRAGNPLYSWEGFPHEHVHVATRIISLIPRTPNRYHRCLVGFFIHYILVSIGIQRRFLILLVTYCKTVGVSCNIENCSRIQPGRYTYLFLLSGQCRLLKLHVSAYNARLVFNTLHVIQFGIRNFLYDLKTWSIDWIVKV